MRWWFWCNGLGFGGGGSFVTWEFVGGVVLEVLVLVAVFLDVEVVVLVVVVV